METFTKTTVGNTRILESLLCLKIDIFAKQTEQDTPTPPSLNDNGTFLLTKSIYDSSFRYRCESH